MKEPVLNRLSSHNTRFKKGESGFKGRKHSEETKAKMRGSHSYRPILRMKEAEELKVLRKENAKLKAVIQQLVLKYVQH